MSVIPSFCVPVRVSASVYLLSLYLFFYLAVTLWLSVFLSLSFSLGTIRQIFGSSLKDTLEPKLSWLSVRLKADRERVAVMVNKYPQILTYSIEDNLAPTIDFFEFGMGEVKVCTTRDVSKRNQYVLHASLRFCVC